MRPVRFSEQAQGQDQAAHVQHAQVFGLRLPDQGEGGARWPPEDARVARAEFQVGATDFIDISTLNSIKNCINFNVQNLLQGILNNFASLQTGVNVE